MNGSVLTANVSTQPAPARALAPAARSGLRDAAVIVAIWTVVALLSAGFGALNRIYSDQPPEWARLLTLNLLAFELCIPATLVFVWAVRRWPLGAGRWRYAPFYLGAIPVLVVLKYAIYLPIRLWWFPTPLAQIKSHLIESFFYEGFMLTLVVGVVHAVEYQRSVREGQLRASQLENHLTRARLEILRNELQPHFLFNALHSISTLMHRNVGGLDVAVHEGGDGMQRVEEEVGLQLVAQDLQSRPGQVILQLRGAQLTLAHGPLVLDRVYHSGHQRQHEAFVEEALDQVRLDLRERRREPPQPDGEIDGVLEHHQHRDGAEVEGHISPAPGAERPAPDGPDEGEGGRDAELEGEQVEREQAPPLGRLVRVDPVEASEPRRKKRDHRPDGADHRRVAQAASRRGRQRAGRRRLGRHICGEDGAVHREVPEPIRECGRGTIPRDDPAAPRDDPA